MSRANSIGSTSASSVPNTDDEDSDYQQESYKESYKDRRRRAHTQAEQKRRDAIKVTGSLLPKAAREHPALPFQPQRSAGVGWGGVGKLSWFCGCTSSFQTSMLLSLSMELVSSVC